MTRAEHLVYCKKCTHRVTNTSQGIICGLTLEKADFESTCANFNLDHQVAQKIKQVQEQIKPNHNRADWAQIMVWLVVLLDIVAFYSSYLQLKMLELYNAGEFISDEWIATNDSREIYVGIIYFIAFLASGIVFIMWFRRAYFNLSQRAKINHSEGWAAGSWFVPVITLFRPFQIMKEMWNKTDILIKNKKPQLVKDSSTILLGIWWTLWIVSHVIGQYSIKLAFKGNSILELINSTKADMYLSALGLPLGAITVLVIRKYARKEEVLLALEKLEVRDFEMLRL